MSSIVYQNGVPFIEIHGELFAPAAFRSFRPKPDNLSLISRAGVRLCQMLVSGRPGSKSCVELLRENVVRLIEGWGDKFDMICPPHNGTPFHAKFLEYLVENCDRIMSGIEGDLDVGSLSYLYNPLEDRSPEQIQKALDDPLTRRSEWMGTSIVYNSERIFKSQVE